VNWTRIVASLLEALGVLAVAGGVGFLAVWAGIVTLGAGLVLFGIALERGDSPPSQKDIK
jgi:hypothetical protein